MLVELKEEGSGFSNVAPGTPTDGASNKARDDPHNAKGELTYKDWRDGNGVRELARVASSLLFSYLVKVSENGILGPGEEE